MMHYRIMYTHMFSFEILYQISILRLLTRYDDMYFIILKRNNAISKIHIRIRIFSTK